VTLYPKNPIEIQFVCGYGATAAIPQDIKTMILVGIEKIFDRPTDSYTTLLDDIFSRFAINRKIYGEV
jgi:hypothetical protein